MAVEIITHANAEIEAAFATLIPQLSKSASPMNLEQLNNFLAQENIYLFGYFSEAPKKRKLLGILTLVTFEIPTGWRAWIEDVVVDSGARGQGAGHKLVEAATEYANQLGVKSIDLTSRPSREAANRLYQRCGFALRETNIYRYQG